MSSALAVLAVLATTLPSQAKEPQAQAKEPQAYVLNTSTGAPYATEQRTGFLDLLVAEVFRRIDRKGEVAMYGASKRALINANDDVDQGVAMRIRNLEKTYPNLLRVPERVIENDFVAYSLGLKEATDSWDSLKQYSVAHIHGWVVFERNMPAGQNATTLKEPSQMFTMLQKGRVDMALYERWQGLYSAKTLGMDITVHEPPLASVDMFMYVHKSHAELVAPLAQALRDMKADGTYQAIFDKTLADLIPVDNR